MWCPGNPTPIFQAQCIAVLESEGVDQRLCFDSLKQGRLPVSNKPPPGSDIRQSASLLPFLRQAGKQPTDLALTSLPPPHGREEAVPKVVLAVGVALDVIPFELVLPSPRAAHPVAFIAHCRLVALLACLERGCA